MKYTGKQYEQVISLYKTTFLSTREVAQRTGVGRQTVHDWVKEAGLSRTRNASREHDEATRRKCIEMYSGGLSARKVASLTGISRSSIIRWLDEAELKRSASYNQSVSQTKYSNQVRAAVASMRRRGLTLKEISKETSVPMGSIHFQVQKFEEFEKKLKRKPRISKYAPDEGKRSEVPA